MLIKRAPDLRASDITDEAIYLDRRRFIARAGIGLAAVGAGVKWSEDSLPGRERGTQDDDKLTPYEDVTTYNNFYEFGTDKDEPAKNAHTLRPRPWSIAIEGHVKKPAVYAIEDFLKPHKLEERVYRMRCVEAWSRSEEHTSEL